MGLWDNVDLSDIPAEQRELAELIGIENFKRLVKTYGGSSIYICKEDAILREKRNLEIVERFDGRNYLELAKKYHLTERTIRDIVSSSLKSQVSKNQMSMFDTS